MTTHHAPSFPPLAAITILGSGRLGPTVSGLLALAATVIGARALRRTRRTSEPSSAGPTERPAVGAGLGAASAIAGAVFLAAADSGPGSGNGVVASVAALVLGPVAVILGLLARARVGERDTEPDLAG